MSEQRAILRLNKVAGQVARGPYIAKNKYAAELARTARTIATRGKGILAADESTGTIGKRFDSIKVKNTVENRRAYRELLFTSKDIGKYISGAILYEETLYQKTADGTPFVDVLKKAGVIVGIKVDLGTKVIPGTDNETATQGLTDLDKRCQKYYKQGARFAKWRAVVRISEKTPTPTAIHETAWTLARYASICQQNGLAPIVEPEILIDGDHDIATSQYWTEKVVGACYKALIDQHVLLEGTLLKPNMVTPGKSSPHQVDPDTVARATITALRRTVPAAVPGVTFLSGGQSEEQATVHLNAMNNPKYGNHPWSLTFSYGRALQQSTLKAWRGKKENVAAAQAAFLVRARANSQAQLGKYKGEAASGSANESLYVEKYTY